nr:transcription-associated protein 1 isoform X2 [Parasteatoda tepidariorum]
MAWIPVMNVSVSAPINDPVAVMNTYRSYVSMLKVPVAKNESKLKALPELSGELETIVSDPQYPSFLDQAIKIFIRILGDEEPQFIAEKTTHINLIPIATMSLKALAELPIIVVLMYQLYKMSVHKDVEEFVPLIMTTNTLQPTAQQRSNPSLNKEVYVDFMPAQIKTLSFLAYLVRIYQFCYEGSLKWNCKETVT